MKVFSYLLLPQNCHPPLPCVVCLPGHGRGVDDLVGIKKDGTMRQKPSGYMMDFALQTVKRGFAVLAVEMLGFGHRREEKTFRQKGPRVTSCYPLSGSLLLMGETMIGWRVYDVMRAIDYLESRKEIAKEKIGVMGISGGGTVAFYSAALDTRIKTTIVSGSFCTFYHSIFSLAHCIDNYLPGILRYGEMYDVAGLIAPRALFIEAGKQDQLFPVVGVKEGIEKAKKIFTFFGAEERFDWEICSGGHRFFGRKAFDFLAENLK